MSDGVWVKIWPENYDPSGVPGAAVINDAASNYDSKDAGVEIDGKTYDIYTFTTATTTFSIRLTDEAMTRITDEDVLMAVATAEIPNDFDGDPVELFDSRYRDVLRNAFDVTPYADPGLSLTVETAGMVDALIVGGGGGGSSYGGGGGAGGHLEITNAYLPEGQNLVGVGSGGAGGVHNSGVEKRQSYSGRSSYVGPFYSPGGGAGGSSNLDGFAGGSGGGGVNSAVEGSGVYGIGNDGGRGHVSGAGGGGGGAGSSGQTSPNSGQGGAGGDGDSSSITGSPVTRAGGGGGGAGGVAPGGSGGGGNGGGGGAGTNATNSTGSGGGGGWNGTGGKGGSGIVIVRVEI